MRSVIPMSEAGFPMAPSQDVWDALSETERAELIAALPAGMTEAELSPPEGDSHLEGKLGPRDALRGYFRRLRRRAYVGSELTVYYPRAPRFAPDLFVVLDADPGLRMKWVVSAEGKGLDFVMEVHDGGDRKKDAVRNVERYARLGIPEYFIFDVRTLRLLGHRLPDPDARRYVPIVPQDGALPSHVLGLELRLEGTRVRFYQGSSALLETQELLERVQQVADHLQIRADEETRRADEEAARRAQLEQQVAEMQAELERLRRER